MPEGVPGASVFESLPHRFGGRSSVAAVREAGAALQAGEESGLRFRLAGRVLGRRGQGKLVFCDLDDRSGRLQLMGTADGLGTEAFEALKRVSIGDVVGAEGELLRTRRGEPSLQLSGYELLAPCRRPIPDSWHGLKDVEARYRQRYLDLIVSPGARDLVVARSRIVTALRDFLAGRGFLEVETPVLQPLYGGASALPFVTHHNALDRDLYLRIAVELYLKRLIVGGLEKVFELGRNFRNEGTSFKHNPEFTMLETYEAYADYTDVMAMVEEMIAACAVAVHGSTSFELRGERVDVAPPWPRVPFGEAIERECGVDPLAGPRDEQALRAVLARDGVDHSRDRTWAALADHLLSHYVEPRLVSPTFLVDYPVELSPLSRRKPGEAGVVERFEAFLGGAEMGNGFSELNDPDEQRARFEEQAAFGRAGEQETHPVDEDYLAALEYGLPPTGGFGIGIDRLTMAITGAASIREVILFPVLRER